MNPILTAESLRYAYGNNRVLDGPEFSVARGEWLILIGPNGSGKTTLLRLLAGLTRPVSGRALLAGTPVTGGPPRLLARRVALVPQNLPSDLPFTVGEMALFGRTPHLGLLGIPGKADHEAAERALEQTGLARLAERRLPELSGGERQRAFIARALCQEPELLLLDEPTAFLDINQQIRIMDLLEELCRSRNLAVVMASHDLNLAALYGDRLLLLRGGRQVALGAPEEILRPELLESAYGCRLRVDRNPVNGRPMVMPVPGREGAAYGDLPKSAIISPEIPKSS
ncbi:MAG: ABC transporter ATP-binding protein [Desulfococcaceae bacterium]